MAKSDLDRRVSLMFFEILKASKGLYTDNIFAEMWGKRLAGQEEWQVTEITGYLPLTFFANGDVLQNYRLYGTSEGAGVETENLWNPHTPFTEGKYVNNVGTLSSDPRWRASDYISVNANTQYTFSVDTASGSLGMHAFYDTNNQFIGAIPSGTQSFTTPENAAYARFSYRKTTIEIMLTEGSTAPKSYIPPGYQLPLTNTSGVTENEFDKDAALLGYEIKNGSVVQKVDWFVSDFIEVNPDTHYMATLTGTGCLEYTSKDAEPTSTTINQITGITTLTTTHYLRINAQIANIDGVMFTKGSTAPDHYIPHRYTADYNLYIGSTKLGAEEYVDYESGKVWKMVDGMLTPTDPPVAFPEIQTYEGENTLSSTETVGEVTVKGKIKTAQGG